VGGCRLRERARRRCLGTWSTRSTRCSAAETGYHALSGVRPAVAPARLPAGPRRLAAVVLFPGLRVAELVWGSKTCRCTLAQCMTAYAAITWLGIVRLWPPHLASPRRGLRHRLRHARPLRAARGRSQGPSGACALELRPYGAGLLRDEPVSGSMMVLRAPDAGQRHVRWFPGVPLMQAIDTAVQGWRPAGAAAVSRCRNGARRDEAMHSALLVLFPAAFVAVFWLGSAAMLRLTRRWLGAPASAEFDALSHQPGGAGFRADADPIAVAYHLSHYFSLLLHRGAIHHPARVRPFGLRSGTCSAARTTRSTWAMVEPVCVLVQAVSIIVVGHVIAVVLAACRGAALVRQPACRTREPAADGADDGRLHDAEPVDPGPAYRWVSRRRRRRRALRLQLGLVRRVVGRSVQVGDAEQLARCDAGSRFPASSGRSACRRFVCP